MVTYMFMGLFTLMIGYFVYFEAVLSEDVINNPYNARQEAFAEKIGKSWSFVAKIESPTRAFGVSMETLFKIADVLNIPPSKLFED